MAASKEFDKTVNDSGFPLQLGIRHLVETYPDVEWGVLASEFPWRDPFTEEERFVDLVLASKDRTSNFVVECKRARETEWIFLREKGKKSRRRLKAWVSLVRNGRNEQFDWEDVTGLPESPLSEFCVVRKANQKPPLIESIAAEITRATEEVGQSEMDQYRKRMDARCGLYFPVIVTTAKLLVCDYSMDRFSIAQGEFQENEYTEVPMVRFHKAFGFPRFGTNEAAIPEAATAAERTVLIINAEHLLATLAEWDVESSIEKILSRPPPIEPDRALFGEDAI